MNEETIIERRTMANAQSENKKEKGVWKKVTLGGVSGVLMGAGMMYAAQAQTQESPEGNNEEETAAPEQSVVNEVRVANVSDGLSFAEAFNQARAEVGPGGVFYWHGGIYNTYTEAEWNAMSDEEKSDFAQQVRPEISPADIATPTDAHPDLVAHANLDDDVEIANVHPASDGNAEGDVQVVGYGTVNGHAAVAIDVTGNGEADVAIVDANDNHELDSQDVAVDREGNEATMGELWGESDPSTVETVPGCSNVMENPDVATDMPDYMNEGMVGA